MSDATRSTAPDLLPADGVLVAGAGGTDGVPPNDEHPYSVARADDLFSLAALRSAVRYEAAPDDAGDDAVLPRPCDAPLLDEIPDVWVAWAWGLGCRLIGAAGTPLVTHAAAVGRHERDIGALVGVLTSGRAGPPSDPAPKATDADFVVGAFLACLGRMPSHDDLRHHLELLTRHPHEAVLHALTLSGEARDAFRHPRPWQAYLPADDSSRPTDRPTGR